MAATGPRYSKDEDKTLLAARGRGMSSRQMFDARLVPGRSLWSIQGRLAVLTQLKSADDFDTRSEDLVACNDAFIALMKEAMDKGLETRRRFGVSTDDTPLLTSVRFRPEPLVSGCGSSAGFCAEFGEDNKLGPFKPS